MSEHRRAEISLRKIVIGSGGVCGVRTVLKGTVIDLGLKFLGKTIFSV